MTNIDPDTSVYSIGVVKEMTGLTRRQIRYYEEVDLIKPARTEGNQRIYSENDIERLKKIKELLAGGLNIAGVQKQLGTVSKLKEEKEQKKEDIELADKLSKVSTKKLSSLYPVSNRADLVKLLKEEEEEE
ncbi:MerR family transcriptional regulator [Sporohalobacter salinus]|uniref:MerR family transcriptional regulator n=1 Tax=Sporohalobacter salinus TaxID=1494606 RepID=UPI00195F71EA|nr:MerR family transcriptional regulator [Sporohalobacter salinus]MBM7623897.1 MerR family glutamine synthetase transcriptional repressor [Sporohalobacter salinus]